MVLYCVHSQVIDLAEGREPLRRRDSSRSGRREVRQVLQVHPPPQQLVLLQVRLLRDGKHRRPIPQLLGH